MNRRQIRGWIAALLALLGFLALPGCTSVHDQRIAACEGNKACIDRTNAEFQEWLRDYSATVGGSYSANPLLYRPPTSRPQTVLRCRTVLGETICQTP